MTQITRTECEELRKHAVRGELKPGFYRYVHGGWNHTPSYYDIVVTRVDGVPTSKHVEGPRYEYMYLCGGYNAERVEDRRGFLTDAGVLPYREAYVERHVCNLGHEHDVRTVPAYYNVNFMVPITVTGVEATLTHLRKRY